MLSLFLADRKCLELSMTSGFHWNISIRPVSGGKRKKKLFADLTPAIISVCPNTVSLRHHSYLLNLFRVLQKTWKHTEDGDETLLKVCPLTSAHCHVIYIYHICFWQTKRSCFGAKAEVLLQRWPYTTAHIFTHCTPCTVHLQPVATGIHLNKSIK